MSMRSIAPSFFASSGLVGLPVTHGSSRIFLPPGDCRRNVAWPSHVIERDMRFEDNIRRMTTTTRRRFLRTATAGMSAAALSGFGGEDTADAHQASAGPPAGPGIVDWHAHWVGPHA